MHPTALFLCPTCRPCGRHVHAGCAIIVLQAQNQRQRVAKVFSFRSFLFGILISCAAFAGAQDSTTPVSELPSLEATPATVSDDNAATSDLVVKGFIPDLQRAQMMQDAMDAAKKAEQKKAAAAAAAARTQAAVESKAPAKTTAKQTETAADKERKAKEAADRANGLLPGKAATATASAAASAKKKPAPSKSDSEPLNSAVPPTIALDNKPSVKKAPARAGAEPIQTNAPEGQRTIVEQVPVAPGKSLGIKKVIPLDENGEPAAETQPSAGDSSELTVTGHVVSAQPSSGGRLKLLVDTEKHGTVEVVVEPRIGMRVPVAGAGVTVRGKKLSGDEDKLVLRAESIDRAGGSRPVVYSHGYSSHVVPVLPIGPRGRLGPPPMVYGPPPPYPYF